MRLLIKLTGRCANVQRALGRQAREWLALAAIFLIVPSVGLTALVAPPCAVDRVTAPLWRTVWAPVGASLAAYQAAPWLRSTNASKT
jgi:hypothetical protein